MTKPKDTQAAAAAPVPAPAPSRAAAVNADIATLIRSRNPLLWIVTREEERGEDGILEACRLAEYSCRFWDCATGLTKPDGSAIDAGLNDSIEMLKRIGSNRERAVYVLRDFHAWLDPVTLRRLRSTCRAIKGAPRAEARCIVVLTSVATVPPELSGDAVVVDYPLPDRTEIAQLLSEFVEQQPAEYRAQVAPNGVREAAIDAATGLTRNEATNCYARSMVTAKRVDPAMVAKEKRRVIERERVLSWYEPHPLGLDAIGGNGLLKAWLRQRALAFSPAARAYGIEAPKGVLIAGISGTGKSLAAKCVATALGCPLLGLDTGALKSKFVGESEANIRKALSVADAMGRCVVWLDEVEKAFAGATGPQGDGGVASDAVGKFLTWMQDRAGQAFVVATANDVRGLPPEFLRKGRFDEVFFVDLPTERERIEILHAALRPHGRVMGAIDVLAIARETDGWAGAEIASLVPEAMFIAYADGERQVATADLLAAAANVVPLSKTAAEKITELRAWGKTNARPASAPETTARRAAGELDV